MAPEQKPPQIIVQFPITNGVADYDQLIVIEDWLTEAFSENDLAVVDGHDFGSDSMNIFIVPQASPDDAVTAAKACLQQHELLDQALIAIRQSDDKHVVVWPPSFEGEFTYD